MGIFDAASAARIFSPIRLFGSTTFGLGLLSHVAKISNFSATVWSASHRRKSPTLQLVDVLVRDARRAKTFVLHTRQVAAIPRSCDTGIAAKWRRHVLAGIFLAVSHGMMFSLAFHCCWHVSDAQWSARISAVPRLRIAPCLTTP